MYKPIFQISPNLTKVLMDIEASRQAVSSLPITVYVLSSLRESARLVSTHYSTQIEGNRLTQQQVEEVLQGGTFPNRERDEREVKNYYLALDYVDTLIKSNRVSIQEKDIQTLHGLVMDGKAKPTSYRDGQNVIRDGGSGSIVYMPPEAKDVAAMMRELVGWINHEITQSELPVPIVAAIAHYQFATIHPYYDGNGRTARLLTNLVLHKCGYGLKGVYSLEEYYARNLQGYYHAISVGESHNYYFGRAEADISNWIFYFCEGMADAFAKVRLKAADAEQNAQADQSHLLRELDQKQRQIIALFRNHKYITTRDIADLLQVHPRTALNFCHKWIDDGFVIAHGEGNKNRKYELAKRWLDLLMG